MAMEVALASPARITNSMIKTVTVSIVNFQQFHCNIKTGKH